MRLTAPRDPGLHWVGIRADVSWGREISRLCTPTRRLKVPLGIGEERHQKGEWSTQWCLESGLLSPLYGLELLLRHSRCSWGPLLKVEFWHPTTHPFFMLRDLQTTRGGAGTDGASPVLTAGDIDEGVRVRSSRGSAICGHNYSCQPHCAGGLPGPAFGEKRTL